MKFEEKRKKNCEISHIVRPEVTLEVYNQKQNKLFISECVEHRRFKVTWTRLCVYSGVCTVESTFRARDSVVREYGSDVRVARRFVTHGSGGRAALLFVTHGSDERVTRRSGKDIRDARLRRARDSAVHDDRLGYSLCTARLVVVHGLVGTRPQFGHDAQIGCTRAKLCGHD